MIVEIKVPQLPESVSEATLMEWHKKIGEVASRDETLIDLETDKVVLEIPCPQEGALVEIIEPNGATVTSGQVIARLDTAVKAGEAVVEAASTKAADKETSAPVTEAIAMPAAEKLAREKGIALNQIKGSGKDGRILVEDVQNAVAQSASAPVSTVSASPSIAEISLGERPEQRVPMSRLRQRVAERLIESQQQNAILTTFNEVNMKPVMDLRNKYKDIFLKEHDVKLGFMSFFVKAAVAALKKYPVANASIDGTDIVYHSYFDIGIAIGSKRGLVVPILRNVELMSIAEIEQQIADFAVKAQDGKIALEDLTGGTFSITNGGTFGSMMSTPIINPPQAAILGMHAIKDRAVVEDGQIVIRPMMYLALSYDHRLIDGREAVLTLSTIKDYLEDPSRLILEV